MLGPTSVYKGRISALSTKYSLKVAKSDAVYCGMWYVWSYGQNKKNALRAASFFWVHFLNYASTIFSLRIKERQQKANTYLETYAVLIE